MLGTTPDQAAAAVKAAVTGETGHVLSVIKHFPGHGAVAADSHSTIPTTNIGYEQWRETAALPFVAGIDAGVNMVMMGHLEYAEIAAGPASLSPQWHTILRDDLGFEGVIVTDDMKMLRENGDPALASAVDNAVTALNAGSTLILDIGRPDMDAYTFADHMISGIVAAVEDGTLSEETLRSAGLQIIDTRFELLDAN